MPPADPRLKLCYVPASHLDLFWLGTHFSCLERGAELIKAYLDACLADSQQTYLIETPVFADYFLRRYPDYREPLLRLVEEGRVEVGACYVDRFETVGIEESLIRHNLFGKRWCRMVLNRDVELACHFDLPGYVPQIAQICAGSGIAYYLTSRKAFPYGKVFRYVSPDGSKVECIHFPFSYGYTRTEQLIEHRDAVIEGFPRGVILMAGGAGDLAGLETFVQRYGKSLVEFIVEDRERHPGLAFDFTTPTPIFEQYARDDLPEYAGEVPSVWGIFSCAIPVGHVLTHQLEAALLVAEQVSALASLFGCPPLPERAESWKGVLHDERFFARDDLIPVGRELEELWRIQLVCQDHNAGGQEGVLTEFYKLDLRRRAIDYARQIADHRLAQLAGARNGQIVLYNPLSWLRSDVVELTLPEDGPVHAVDRAGASLPTQLAPGGQALEVLVRDLPPLGFSTIRLQPGEAPPVRVNRIEARGEDNRLVIRTPTVEAVVDRTGALRSLRLAGDDFELLDPDGRFGDVVAYREADNDVRMRLAPEVMAVAETVDVRLAEVGCLAARIAIERRFIESTLRQTISIYADLPRVDLETRLFWWGATDLQVHQLMPLAPGLEQIYYGTPFHATNWRERMPEAHPWKRDEILPKDFERYREALRWIDLSDGNRGITIASIHSAYKVEGPKLAAVLLRTGYSCGDRRFYWHNAGELVWRYSLWPHEGDWREARTYRRGWEQAFPIYRLESGASAGYGVAPIGEPLIGLAPDSLVLTGLKPAESGPGLVLRCFEAEGRPAEARVSLAKPIRAARRTNLIEDDRDPVPFTGGEVRLKVRPWEIVTLRLET